MTSSDPIASEGEPKRIERAVCIKLLLLTPIAFTGHSTLEPDFGPFQ